MHRYADVLLLTVAADRLERALKVIDPIEGIHLMRSERDKIRRDPEKIESVVNIPPKHLLETIQVCPDSFHEPFFGITFQPKRFIAPTLY